MEFDLSTVGDALQLANVLRKRLLNGGQGGLIGFRYMIGLEIMKSHLAIIEIQFRGIRYKTLKKKKKSIVYYLHRASGTKAGSLR